jgi:hypothetical protein
MFGDCHPVASMVFRAPRFRQIGSRARVVLRVIGFALSVGVVLSASWRRCPVAGVTALIGVAIGRQAAVTLRRGSGTRGEGA